MLSLFDGFLSLDNEGTERSNVNIMIEDKGSWFPKETVLNIQNNTLKGVLTHFFKNNIGYLLIYWANVWL